jgi:allantoinase
LWEALLDGTIDMVVSDHSPCVAELKKPETGDFMDAWGGISTLGLGLSLLSTAAQKRGIAFERLLAWCSVNTALHSGLADRKGGLAVGKDADLAVWDAETVFKVCGFATLIDAGSRTEPPLFQVTKESLNFKNKLSPYVGLSLTGQVVQTYVRGTLVFDREAGFSSRASGEFV